MLQILHDSHFVTERFSIQLAVVSLLYMHNVSQKNPPPLRICGNFSKTVGNFSTKFYVPIMCSYLW